LVESLAAPFEPDKYQDAYREQVLDLLARKASGEELEAPAPAVSAPQVIDLMAALEASVKAAKEARGRHPTTTSHPAPAGIGAAADTDDADVVEVKPKARARARKSA
jgi:DNA end-binding protein Ku